MMNKLLTIIIISLFTLCTHAQYVVVNCTDPQIVTNGVTLGCAYYTIEQSARRNEREVIIVIPENISANSVVEIALDHPSVPFFVNETLVAFPNLRKLLIYGGLVTMQPYAFAEAQNLESLTIISEWLTVVPDHAFTGATKLQSILFFACYSILKVDEDAFVGLDNLEDIYFQSSPLLSVPINLFKPLINLRYVGLFDTSNEIIHSELFASNAKLESLIIFPQVKAVERTFIDNLPKLSYILIDGSCLDDGGITFTSSNPSRSTHFQSAMQRCYSNYDAL